MQASGAVAVRAPANARAEADHVCKCVDGAGRVGGESIDLDFQGVVDAEAANDEILVDPLAKLLCGLFRIGGNMLDQEVGEVL